MRLLIATPLYPPELGGPATYATILEQELPPQGVAVQVEAFSGVRQLPRIVRHIVYFFRLLRKGRDADCLLALDPVSTGLPALLAARLLRKPFVVKVVGDYAWEQGTQRYGVSLPLDEFVHTKHVPTQVELLRTLETWVTKQASLVIVPSEYLKRIVCAWGVPQQHIEVVYNAMQQETPGVLPEDAFLSTRPKIVSAGRLVPWKGFGALIDAVVDLQQTFPDAMLLVAGDGPDRASLEAYGRARLGSQVHFLGTLTHAETLALIQDADVFVLNSTYEGLSHILIEALSLGTAVIATSVGGNPELITNRENGILVPSGDREALKEALKTMLSDDALRTRLKQEALQTSTRFSSGIMSTRTAELLTKCL